MLFYIYIYIYLLFLFLILSHSLKYKAKIECTHIYTHIHKIHIKIYLLIVYLLASVFFIFYYYYYSCKIIFQCVSYMIYERIMRIFFSLYSYFTSKLNKIHRHSPAVSLFLVFKIDMSYLQVRNASKTIYF
jgi:hypothetical protein